MALPGLWLPDCYLASSSLPGLALGQRTQPNPATSAELPTRPTDSTEGSHHPTCLPASPFSNDARDEYAHPARRQGQPRPHVKPLRSCGSVWAPGHAVACGVLEGGGGRNQDVARAVETWNTQGCTYQAKVGPCGSRACSLEQRRYVARDLLGKSSLTALFAR